MAGLEDVLVQWAPTVAPLAAVADGDWVLLADWQKINATGGQQIEQATPTFTVGTAKIRHRNGDTIGHTPTFLPTTSYKGRNIRVTFQGASLFIGRVDRVEYHYENTPWAGQVTLHCVDTIGNVADGEIPDELFEDTVDYFTQVADMETAFQETIEHATLSATVAGEFTHQLVKAPDKFETRQALVDFLNEILVTEGAQLYASPEDGLRLIGRWKPLSLLATDAVAPVIFTDTNPSFPTSHKYRRDDLEWSDSNDDYANSVQTASKYLNVTVTEENVAVDYPRVQLSRTELVTIRQGWVEANARMWHTLYSQTRAYPKKLKFLVASPGHVEDSALSAVGVALAWPLFDMPVHVLHTPPGSTQITYRCAVNASEHDIDRQRWLCTLGFTSLDRWWFGYGNGTDPIDLVTIDGDAGHGIDSLAIIAP